MSRATISAIFVLRTFILSGNLVLFQILLRCSVPFTRHAQITNTAIWENTHSLLTCPGLGWNSKLQLFHCSSTLVDDSVRQSLFFQQYADETGGKYQESVWKMQYKWNLLSCNISQYLLSIKFNQMIKKGWQTLHLTCSLFVFSF